MKKTIIHVTWQETYRASMGSGRLVSNGHRTFHTQMDADDFVDYLHITYNPNDSIFAGRDPKIENVQMRFEQV